MKLILPLIIVLLLPIFASAKNTTENEQVIPSDVNQLQTLKLSAKAYLLYDLTSKQVLLEQNSHDRIEPASLTKLMTAYIAFSALKQNKISNNEKVTPSIQAIRFQSADAKMFLDHKKPVTIDDLLHGLIIVSANDAARVLAERIAQSEANFAVLMNQEAQRLGMLDTHFANASGLPDPLHYSSAHDMSLLTVAIINDFPEYYPLYSQREYEYNHIRHFNRNRLLWLDPYVDGMKTGHTESAGFSLIATAKRNNHRLISVIMGAATDQLRSTESQRLLNYGFQNFDLFNFYKENETIRDIRLWKGTESSVKAGMRDKLIVTIPKGQRASLVATIETEQPLLAPISKGQQVGILKLTFEGKPFRELPLVALESIPLVNIFSRGIDSIRMIFSR
jgi:D-alanyl-D-alanine carboxypeptidase (penicillin-binding protein 5/6)